MTISKNFWAGLTKSEIRELIRMHKDVATMNEMQIEARKKEAAEALRTHLLEKEAEWWDRAGHVELFNDLHSRNIINLTDRDIEQMTEGISQLAWLDPNMETRLNLARGQATDGYKQAQDAFKLLENVYDFLSRLDNVVHKATWIHRYVTDLKQRIEGFLPGIKEKHS